MIAAAIGVFLLLILLLGIDVLARKAIQIAEKVAKEEDTQLNDIARTIKELREYHNAVIVSKEHTS